MRNKATTLIASTLALLSLVQPLSALADSKGERSSSSRSESRSSNSSESRSGSSSESRSSSSSDSRSGKSESGSSSRRESDDRNESRPGMSDKKEYGQAKISRSDDGNGHERGEGRRDWDAKQHQENTEQEALRPALTPEAAALMTQARKAAFEYRTTGSAESLAALQGLRSSLVAMGFTRTADRLTPAPVTTPAAPSTIGTAPATGVVVQ